MKIPAAKWYKAIETRRSRRRFEQKPLEAKALSQMAAVCEDFRPFPAARSVLITETPDLVFKGAVGHYGKVKGAPAFIAFIMPLL